MNIFPAVGRAWWTLILAALAPFGCDGSHAGAVSGGLDGAVPGDASVASAPKSWQLAPGWAIREQLAAASAGSEAAIAYVQWSESEGERWRIMLQRLDHTGAQIGAAVELAGKSGPIPYGRLTLATDGRRY